MTDTPQPATGQPSTENPTPGAVAAADAGEESPVEWSTGRPVHFEIHAEDPRRAVEFYSTVFGWTSEGEPRASGDEPSLTLAKLAAKK